MLGPPATGRNLTAIKSIRDVCTEVSYPILYYKPNNIEKSKASVLERKVSFLIG